MVKLAWFVVLVLVDCLQVWLCVVCLRVVARLIVLLFVVIWAIGGFCCFCLLCLLVWVEWVCALVFDFLFGGFVTVDVCYGCFAGGLFTIVLS